ncbi:MAG: T9SS type A sorting domain-containing protein, partial [Bacteroidales bacterium]|nr:T9SS type A sorting domain-containing protein [Bacteroidales bacterium]
NAVSWYWAFNDGNPLGTNYSQNPEQSFENNIGSGLYVSANLLIEDNIGCTSSASTTLMINPNTLLGGIVARQPAVCYGNPWTIDFAHSLGTPTTNPVYNWHETNQTTSVYHNDFYETGSYYVRVTDNNGCATQSDWANICFKSVPIAEISGEANYCPDGVINLIGDSGNHTYQWTGLDPLVVTTPNLSYDITSYELSVGNYTVTLTVSDNGCHSTASKSITVHSAPTAPTIGFGANRCLHIPPVNLISTASHNLHWSTGTFGSATETFNAGIHTAYYTDINTGCRSENAEIDVPKPPDFNELMTGCFEFCEQDLPRTVLGPLGSYDAWKWNLDNIIIQGGTGYISNLNVPSFGTYFLDVSYPTVCQSTSDNLVVSQKKFCDSCNIVISLLKEPECGIINCELRVRFTLSIYNAGIYTAYLNNVSSPMINTLYSPSLSQTINPGTSASLVFEVGLASFEPSDLYLEFLFDENGRPCISHFYLDISDVLFDCITEECDISVGYFDINNALSYPGMPYYGYYFSSSIGMSNVQLYSDDVTIIDFNYDPVTGNISGILFIPWLQVQQLIANGSDICFRLYACDGNKICSGELCVSAMALAIKGKSISTDNSQETEDNADIGNSLTTDFCLYPNPATSIVSISGDNFSRATVIDTGGRVMMEVYDTTFDIGTLRNGEYIVKVISLDGDIQYLKLVKR